MMAKKSVGIMTFHWAANYGAVLQAWALQDYLMSLGFDAKLIDYVPQGYRATLLRCLKAKRPGRMLLYFHEYQKERYLKRFRSKYLNRTASVYSTKEQLKSNPPQFDCYISGSDQIWNPYYTMKGQNGITLSYYLDFAPKSSKRVAFSSSFGLSQIPDEMKKVIAPELSKFTSVSVRENTGVNILDSIGINASLTADPTLLLRADSYRKIFTQTEKQRKLFFYCLHGQRKEMIIPVRAYAKAENLFLVEDSHKGIEEWLQQIDSADFVITNSFHGVVFCILFHVPFLAFEKKIKGHSMGGRLTTLLETVGLENRFCSADDLVEQLDYLKDIEIDWKHVDESVQSIREKAQHYIKEALDVPRIKTICHVDSRKCTGCGLCKVICPVKCISMKEDELGFMVPNIDATQCIQCGRCYKECIAIDAPQSHDEVMRAYSCYHIDEDVRQCSSSGGAFSALASEFIAKDGKIIGAAYTGDLEVKHICIDNDEEIKRLRGSKYLVSNAWDIFSDIKSMLEKGERILFSGTPCQVAAIRKYTKNHPLLTSIDLACHGIPSSLVVRAHCAEISKKESVGISSIDFRDKISGWKNYSYTYYGKNKQKLASEQVHTSSLGKAYVNNIISRRSCLECPFACERRQGDITLCDNWRILQLGVDKENKGITGVWVNSEKGRDLFDAAKVLLNYEVTTRQEIIAGNPVLSHTLGPNSEREDFFKELQNSGYAEAKRKYCMPPSVTKRVINRVKRMVIK